MRQDVRLRLYKRSIMIAQPGVDGKAPPHLRANMDPTDADRVLMITNMLENAMGPGFELQGCGYLDLERLDQVKGHDPRVVCIFPLHDKSWTSHTLADRVTWVGN